MTGGLAFAAWISAGVSGAGFLAGLVIGLIAALPFLVGWRLLRSRPRIGPAVIGVSAAVWMPIAVVGANELEGTEPAATFVVFSLVSAAAAAVQSVRVIRSPEE